MLVESRGIAYQRDMRAGRVSYDVQYLEKVMAYENTAVAKTVNAGRCALLARHADPKGRLLDVGAGTGAFVRAARSAGYMESFGYEVIPNAARDLQAAHMYADNATNFNAVTFWDSLEHIEDPGAWLNATRKNGWIFVSLPIFDSLSSIRASKHYRPGEHLYYWTRQGFVDWAALYGLRLVEESAHEVQAGRERIGAFAFRRDLPDYNDHIGAYQDIHSTRHYGNSAADEYLGIVAKVVKERQPKSILDYGCGRSDLAAYFWRDGERTIARYDPAIPKFMDIPKGKFDLVFCMDVMEHIPMAGVDRVLAEVKDKGNTAMFAISTIKARAKLPDGRNAHVTLLSKDEWRRWIASVFGPLQELPAKHEHELVLLAGSMAA